MNNKFISSFAHEIESMLYYREALGFLRETHEPHLLNFDNYCAIKYPEANCLTKSMVFDWLEEQLGKITDKAAAIRLLGKYLCSVGKESFILPNGFYPYKKSSVPYIFTDSELSALFRAADTFKSISTQPFLHEIVPVMFRLIYTCGLRPNEGRELLCDNINLKTGEILITNTKGKKERTVVMSNDMLDLCIAYDKCRKIFSKSNCYFFPSWAGGVFSSKQINNYFKNCWERTNPKINKSELPAVRVYDLRHRFASAVLNRWLDNSKNLSVMLPYLRAYMGHGNISETAYYIHLLPENLVKSAGIDWKTLDGIVPEVQIW
jgi:integrase